MKRKMNKQLAKHKWSFTSRFRAGAYGQKASRLAIQRIKEAVSEIKQANRNDHLLATEGAVLFIEKLVPAIAEIDSSSSALGTATNNTLYDLVSVIEKADADPETREKWLERLWEAVQDDGYGYLNAILPEIWGELCVDKATASRWADDFLDTVKHSWQYGGYFVGDTACLSCLLAAGRHEELLDLLQQAPRVWWHYRRYGVQALLRLGRKAEALRYANESCGLNDNLSQVEEACEDVLLSSGLSDEAYRQYAIPRLVSRPGLATFRKVAKKYPEKDQQEMLNDALENTPFDQDKGKWFATAKQLGMLELARHLALHSPVEPKTLNRAAKDYRDSNPAFALCAAIASLHWLSQGWGYEIDSSDVYTAYSLALEAGQKTGGVELVKSDIAHIIEQDRSPGMFVKQVLGHYFKTPR